MEKNSFILAVVVLMVVLLTSCGNRIPKCDSKETLSLVSDLVSQGAGLVVTKIDNIRLLDTDKGAGINICECDVLLGYNEGVVGESQKSNKDRAPANLEVGPYIFKYATQYTTGGKISVKSLYQ